MGLMFTFGTLDTSSFGLFEGHLPRMLATLQAWPSMRPEPDLVPQLDGALYGRTRLAPVELTFDVRLTAPTVAEVLQLRDALLAGLRPELGLQALVPEASAGWAWRATAASVSDFTRGLWVDGYQCTLTGTVTFVAPDGTSYLPGEAASSGTVTAQGNLAAYPRIEVAGPFSATTISTTGFSVTVDIAVASTARLVLDYAAQDYGIWVGSNKVGHAAHAMSHHRRLALPPGQSRTLTATAGTLSVVPNSRKG